MRLPLVLILPLFLCSCAAAAVTGIAEGGKAAADERSFGRQVDDVSLYTAINKRFLDAGVQDIVVNVTINVRHGRVLLTGNVDEGSSAQKAAELAWQASGVQEVINEITVKKESGIWNNANDALIKKNLEARLLVTKDVWVVSYSIDVVNGTAYLLGSTNDQPEMDRVLNVARTTSGVKRVVNYLKLNSDVLQSRSTAAAASDPSNTSPFSGQASGSGTQSYEQQYMQMQQQTPSTTTTSSTEQWR